MDEVREVKSQGLPPPKTAPYLDTISRIDRDNYRNFKSPDLFPGLSSPQKEQFYALMSQASPLGERLCLELFQKRVGGGKTGADNGKMNNKGDTNYWPSSTEQLVDFIEYLSVSGDDKDIPQYQNTNPRLYAWGDYEEERDASGEIQQPSLFEFQVFDQDSADKSRYTIRSFPIKQQSHWGKDGNPVPEIEGLTPEQAREKLSRKNIASDRIAEKVFRYKEENPYLEITNGKTTYRVEVGDDDYLYFSLSIGDRKYESENVAGTVEPGQEEETVAEITGEQKHTYRVRVPASECGFGQGGVAITRRNFDRLCMDLVSKLRFKNGRDRTGSSPAIGK